MPVSNNVFSRIWQHVSQFAAGDPVTRGDMDVMADDLAIGINHAIQAGVGAQQSADQNATDLGNIRTSTDLISLGAVGDNATNDSAVIDAEAISGRPIDLLGRTYFYDGSYTPSAGTRLYNGSVRDNDQTHDFSVITRESYESLTMKGTTDVFISGVDQARNSIRKISDLLAGLLTQVPLKVNAMNGTLTGTTTVNRVRVQSVSDVSLGSTDHGVQIGDTNALNVAMDNNEVQARNAGVASTYFVNQAGGDVNLSRSGDTTTVQGDLVVDEGATITGALTLSGTANLGAVFSDTSKVGCLLFCLNNSGALLLPGSTVSGTFIRSAGMDSTGSGTFVSLGVSLSGTWTCLGTCPDQYATLFVRTA